MAVVPMLGGLAMALNIDAGSTYREVVAYATLHHNPFFPLVALVSAQGAPLDSDILVRLGFCLAVWIVLNAIFARVAVRSLHREVY
jgi:hypothetical protein